LVVPTLDATTTAPAGSVPVVEDVVTEIGVPVVGVAPGKPVIEADAVTVALTHSVPSAWSVSGEPVDPIG
jgi:hypothetical protein